MRYFILICAVVALVGCGKVGKKVGKEVIKKGAAYKTGKFAKNYAIGKTGEEFGEIVASEIRQRLDRPTGELTKADLEKVTRLDLQLRQLPSVKGLEKLTQLKELDLRDNPDLTKSQIDELQKALPNCKIYYNPPLTKEESVKIIESAIRERIKKPEGELTEVDYEKPEFLNLKNNQLTDVKGLEKLTQLTRLYLNNNYITDVKGLEKLTQLKVLYLHNNQLTDVRGLESLTKLETLVLIHNQLTDVKGLEKLTQLKGLWLQGNIDLTKAQIDELKKALPKCVIEYTPKK